MEKKYRSTDYAYTRKLSRIAYLYYIEEVNQATIAKRLGYSKAKVSRLLRQARESGLVEITIHSPEPKVFEIELDLQNQYNIDEALVIPYVSDDFNVTMQAIGKIAADYLLENLQDGDTVCISGGKAISALVSNLETTKFNNVKIVAATGGVQGQMSVDVNTLAIDMAQRLNAKAYLLHAPVLVDSIEEHDALVSMRQVSEIIEMARQAKFALVGVGSVQPNTSSYLDMPYINETDREHILKDYRACSEILAFLVDDEGELCVPEYNKRVIGISLEDLKKIPVSVAVSGTKSKIQPLQCALKGGYINRLITDEVAAKGILTSSNVIPSKRKLQEYAHD